MKKFFHIIILITLLAEMLAPVSSFAFQKTKLDILPQNDFVVEPGKTEINLNPGESVVKNIIVTNRVDKKVKFKLSTEDFIGTDDPKKPVILLGENYSPYSLKDFILPEINEFELDLGERITIPITISVPKNAEPRGYYGALIISNEPDKIPEGNSADTEGRARIISRIGSLFLLRINGEGKYEGRIESFKNIGPIKSVFSGRPQGFEIAFKNTGNVHLVPYGTITITNIFGRTVDTLPVDAYFVLPDSTRYREILWGNGFSLGRYTAHLSLNKGFGDTFDGVDYVFWVLPWKILIIAFVILAVLVALVYYFLTRFELKKKDRKI